ncbi:MAG: NlpC/P60 family protein [Nevskiaceae bacterium]|nr:MAG: NlpC/P60 family protein [Nevskiaceae bacterium]
MPAALRRWGLLLSLLLGACASNPGTPLDDNTRAAIVTEALGQIGRPYVYGGSTPEGFDCSGLVQYSYAQAGVSLPRTTGEQLKTGKDISLSDAEPGDLLFYKLNGALHVAIYVGDGRAVHAPARGKQVIVAPVDIPYWQRSFITAVRVLR